MTLAYRLEEVIYRYGDKTVLDIRSLNIGAGKITALIGPNGAGKSTLLNLLAFLKPPCHGKVRLGEQTAHPKHLLALRRQIGLVAQNPYLLRGTVLDNVELGLKLRGAALKLRRRRALEALGKVGLGGFACRKARELSGGEAQKVALARALALEPRVLLFDEPFTYLDQGSVDRTEKLIRAYIQEQGGTVVFSTHDRLHGLALADEVVSLVAGRLIAAPLVNVFHGRVRAGSFETGKISIVLPCDVKRGAHASIDPHEIVLSRTPLTSSLRNVFLGRIVAIAEEGGRVRVTVEAGERFQALITHQSLNELALSLGKPVWVHFKSTALNVF